MQYWRLKMLRAGLGGLVEFRWQKGRSAPGRRARQVLETKKRRRENFVTADTRHRRCGNTILTDKAADG